MFGQHQRRPYLEGNQNEGYEISQVAPQEGPEPNGQETFAVRPGCCLPCQNGAYKISQVAPQEGPASNGQETFGVRHGLLPASAVGGRFPGSHASANGETFGKNAGFPVRRHQVLSVGPKGNSGSKSSLRGCSGVSFNQGQGAIANP